MIKLPRPEERDRRAGLPDNFVGGAFRWKRGGARRLSLSQSGQVVVMTKKPPADWPGARTFQMPVLRPPPPPCVVSSLRPVADISRVSHHAMPRNPTANIANPYVSIPNSN